jgi:Tfp pilus assembly protein PilN
MSAFDLHLNLSTRPFKPYRAANLGLAALLLFLLGVSVWQGYNYLYYSSLVAGISAKEAEVRAEAEDLTARLTKLNGALNRSEVKAQVVEIDFLNQLIQRKRFSWTRVFAILEDLLPEGVYLVSLRPAIGEDGSVLLAIQVRGRTTTDAIQFVHVLEESRYFDNVVAPTEQATQRSAPQGGEIEIEVQANYFPERASE